ncbi:hypothetical protein [Longimicrobium sp.]|uniref:hypothetical protein n=1 Tax=Longimicrobium sp. TaxID=2029185 RepID=UPI002CA86E84|nr:hypothetical protein [Longimicrobium sp.]HSU14889.1 hypothetical protein [Longimicrobium sp.]
MDDLPMNNHPAVSEGDPIPVPFAGLQRALEEGRFGLAPDTVRIRRFVPGWRANGPPAEIRKALIRYFAE